MDAAGSKIDDWQFKVRKTIGGIRPSYAAHPDRIVLDETWKIIEVGISWEEYGRCIARRADPPI